MCWRQFQAGAERSEVESWPCVADQERFGEIGLREILMRTGYDRGMSRSLTIVTLVFALAASSGCVPFNKSASPNPVEEAEAQARADVRERKARAREAEPERGTPPAREAEPEREAPPAREEPVSLGCQQCSSTPEGKFCGQCGKRANRGDSCGQCGVSVSGKKFCGQCGAKVEPHVDTDACAKCGAQLGNKKFCSQCGAKANRGAKEAAERRDRGNSEAAPEPSGPSNTSNAMSSPPGVYRDYDGRWKAEVDFDNNEYRVETLKPGSDRDYAFQENGRYEIVSQEVVEDTDSHRRVRLKLKRKTDGREDTATIRLLKNADGNFTKDFARN
jgi:hypothetical protein